jgi:predicted DNA-binding protein
MSSDKKIKTIIQVKKEIAQLNVNLEDEQDEIERELIEREIEKLEDFLIFIKG